MYSRHHLTGVVLAAALIVASTVSAEGREDFYAQFEAQRYFNLPQHARTLGMGGSSIVTSSDSSSVVGNPAGLGWMKDAEVSATYLRDQVSGNDADTYAEIEQDIDAGHVLGAFPIVPTLDGTPRYGTLGVGWSGQSSEVDDSNNTETEGYGLHAAYGKDLNPNLALGYAFDYIYDRASGDVDGVAFKNKMSDGVRQSVGMQYKTSAATTVGASTFYGFGTRDLNVAGGEETVAEDDLSSWGADLGIGHKMGSTLLTGSVDYTLYNADISDDFYAWGFRTGLEQSFTDWLKGRVGYRYYGIFDYEGDFGNDNAKYNAVSFGAGVRLMKNLMADYGADFRWVGDDSDWTHAISLTVPFSLCVD